MVQSNLRIWTVTRFKATIISSIWPEVLFFTIFATGVTLIHEFTYHKIEISTTLLTVLGTVLGLVISFRTSSAYERFQEGRKFWGTILVASRNLAHLIWFHVPEERKEVNGKKPSALEVAIEKKSMINLIQAFAVSVKHSLRGERGVYYDDLYPLIAFLPKYADKRSEMLPLWITSDTIPAEHGFVPQRRSDSVVGSEVPRFASLERESTLVGEETIPLKRTSTRSVFKPDDDFDPEKALPFIECDRILKPARNPPHIDYLTMFRPFNWMLNIFSKRGLRGRRLRKNRVIADVVESNIPLEIALYLSNYASFAMQMNIPTPVGGGLLSAVTTLLDTTSQLERTRNTPLPFAYQAHLRMSLWLYLMFLPFQLFATFGWFTILATTFVSFLLLGFLEIGQEIETPFGYDLNDLDMDGFCLALQRDLHEITTHVMHQPSDIIFNKWNQPFAPADRRSADELIGSGNRMYCPPGEEGEEDGRGPIRRTFIRSWQEVENVTREFKYV